MKKVRSREHCHSCGEYSDWLFEEREGNQIITCPLCGHLHYRVVGGAYIDFEVEFKGEKISNMNRIREILEEYPESKSDLDKLFAELEFGDLSEVLKVNITGDRWGRDPSQQQGGTNFWTASSTMGTSYTTSYTYNSSSTGGFAYSTTTYY